MRRLAVRLDLEYVTFRDQQGVGADNLDEPAEGGSVRAVVIGPAGHRGSLTEAIHDMQLLFIGSGFSLHVQSNSSSAATPLTSFPCLTRLASLI